MIGPYSAQCATQVGATDLNSAQAEGGFGDLLCRRACWHLSARSREIRSGVIGLDWDGIRLRNFRGVREIPQDLRKTPNIRSPLTAPKIPWHFHSGNRGGSVRSDQRSARRRGPCVVLESRAKKKHHYQRQTDACPHAAALQVFCKPITTSLPHHKFFPARKDAYRLVSDTLVHVTLIGKRHRQRVLSKNVFC